MRPVSHPTVPFGMVSCQTTDVNHARHLLDEWTEWASSAPPGNGERRDRAIENLRYCLENNTDWLDLSAFNLTALPASLPVSIQKLYIGNNQFLSLPERLPSSLQELDASDNQLTALPDNLPASLQRMDVSNNQLISLPERLPVSLQKIDVSNNRLTSLPEAFPASLQSLCAYNNQLITLPGRLPASLQELYVSHNRLTALPEALPDSLREVNVSHNRLTVLPEALPAWLQTLDVGCNRLTCLPAMFPASLQNLYAYNNQLTALPEALPASLQALNLNSNQLISLEETLPVSIRELDVSHNQLTVLPESLPTSLEWLDVSNNELMSLPGTLPAALQVIDARDNWLIFLPETLPASLQQLDISNNRLTSLPLNLTLFIDNLVVGGNPLVGLTSGDPDDFLKMLKYWTHGDNAPQWQKIQSEESAMVFADFLYKLCQGKNKLNEVLHSRVREWLGYLAAEESSELRKQTFLVAEEAVTSCVDRAAFYFNKMYWLMMEDRAIKSGVDAAHLIETIRSGFRLQVLERIAAAHVQRRRREAAGFDEDIEIYFAYQYRLRESLSLPVYTELQFAELAGLTEEEMAQAGAAVLRQEQTDFLRYLVMESTAWRQRLQSWDSEKTAAMEANYLEAIASADFSEAVDRELKENGLPLDDNDARRTVSKKIAEAWLFAARLRLTEDYLTAHKALPCLAPFRD